MYVDFEEMRQMLSPEINKIKDEIRSSGKITNQQACDLKLLMSIIEKSYTVEMFEEYPEESYGRRFYGARRERYSRDHVEPGVYNRGYSTHSEQEILKKQLHSMMQSSTDPHIQKVLQGAMDELK